LEGYKCSINPVCKLLCTPSQSHHTPQCCVCCHRPASGLPNWRGVSAIWQVRISDRHQNPIDPSIRRLHNAIEGDAGTGQAPVFWGIGYYAGRSCLFYSSRLYVSLFEWPVPILQIFLGIPFSIFQLYTLFFPPFLSIFNHGKCSLYPYGQLRANLNDMSFDRVS